MATVEQTALRGGSDLANNPILLSITKSLWNYWERAQKVQNLLTELIKCDFSGEFVLI